MFTVQWIVHGREAAPIESEAFRVGHVSTLITACRYRMELMQRKYPETPPDGFIVFDHEGKEISRWLGTRALP
jgi:hypothetical protein